MMATREIKHRFGKLQYEFDKSINWTQTDQQLADLLAKMLLLSESHLLAAEELGKRAAELNKWVAERTDEWKESGKTLKVAQEIAGGYVGALELGQYSIAEKLSGAVNAANDKIQEQNAHIRGMHPSYKMLIADHNAIQEQHETNLDQSHYQLSETTIKAFKTESIATDMVSFDRAIESLRAVMSVNSKAEEQNLNRTLEVIADYNLLCAQIEGQQNVWEEFCSRMVLIEYIGKLHNDSRGISFN